MSRDTWLRTAVVYAVDVSAFQDSNGDGVGDFPGLVQRLDHIDALGANCIWLLPFYPSPRRDDGYDITDHRRVDPRFGSVEDVRRFVDAAHARGIRVLFDLVLNHTSRSHPWFQAARRERTSPMRDYYVWRDRPDPSLGVEPIFPGESDDVWPYDEQAQAHYLARFYDHEPDLATGHPDVVRDAEKTLAHWIDLGVDGFRLDAAPYIAQKAGWVDPTDEGRWLLARLHDAATARRADVVVVSEADLPPHEYPGMLGRCGDGLFDFHANANLFLALATEAAAPLRAAIGREPPVDGVLLQWVRNHDELDLEQLAERDREVVYNAFEVSPDAEIFGRGLRGRYPPMVHGDRRRVELAHAISCSLPDVPVIRYGEEIGMGDAPESDGRRASRAAMQWDGSERAGFSTAPVGQWWRPLITDEQFGHRAVNVADQQRDPSSLLSWFRRLLAQREAIAPLGRPRVVDDTPDAVLALEYRDAFIAHNLSGQRVSVAVPGGRPWRNEYGIDVRGATVTLPAYGSAWLVATRAREEPSRPEPGARVGAA